MRRLSIVFTKSKKRLAIGSWLIRAWTFKSYSHVAVRFSSRIFKTPTYYQASEGLVNYMSETQFLKKHSIVKEYNLAIPDELYYLIREACHEEAGAPYGLLQNIGIILSDVCSWVNIKIKNPWKEGRNCSELMYVHVFKNLDSKELDPDLVKPHHIEELLTTSYRR
jgi:hypothetical protein